MKTKHRWLYDQVTFQKSLERHFLASPKLISQVSSLLATHHKLRTILKTSSLVPAARLLIVGGTSSGKTHLSSLIPEMLNIPFCRMNLGNIVPEAYKGLSFSDGLMPLIENSNERKRAEKSSCLILDEIDKLVRRDRKDNFYQGIQHSLLGILNGESIQLQDQNSYGSRTLNFNTNNCFTILCGVFPELSKATWKNLDTARKGLVKYGFSNEFVSRLSHFIYLPSLNEKQIREFILNQSKDVAELYRTDNSIPCLSSKEVSAIVKKVQSSPWGLRSSRGYLHEVLERKVVADGFKFL